MSPTIRHIPQRSKIWRGLVARLLPSVCAICGGHAGMDLICARCQPTLPGLPEPHCPICAQPRPSGAGDDPVLPCGSCLSAPPAFDETRAAYVYAAPVDRLILAFKFQSRLASAEFFAARLPAPPPDLSAVVPVPLADDRLAERGYNQAFELARAYAIHHALPFTPDLLRRTRTTAHQLGLPWRERARNLRKAFACAEALNGGHYLVIDDVMTSGATLQEVARTLKAAGAARVSNRVIARALRNSAQA